MKRVLTQSQGEDGLSPLANGIGGTIMASGPGLQAEKEDALHVKASDAEVYFVDVGMGCARMGHEVGVVTPAWNGPVPSLQCPAVEDGECQVED